MENILAFEKPRKERNISNCMTHDQKINLNFSEFSAKFFDKAI